MTQGEPRGRHVCRSVNRFKQSSFLLPNYNKCKNSDTRPDGRRDRVQQNGFRKIAAAGPLVYAAGARRIPFIGTISADYH